jgi:hypothetical protein
MECFGTETRKNPCARKTCQAAIGNRTGEKHPLQATSAILHGLKTGQRRRLRALAICVRLPLLRFPTAVFGEPLRDHFIHWRFPFLYNQMVFPPSVADDGRIFAPHSQKENIENLCVLRVSVVIFIIGGSPAINIVPNKM